MTPDSSAAVNSSILLVPAHYFFTEVVVMPPELTEAELDDFVACELERQSPFDLDQLYWGSVKLHNAGCILYYAAVKQRLHSNGYDPDAGYAHVLPAFLSLPLTQLIQNGPVLHRYSEGFFAIGCFEQPSSRHHSPDNQLPCTCCFALKDADTNHDRESKEVNTSEEWETSDASDPTQRRPIENSQNIPHPLDGSTDFSIDDSRSLKVFQKSLDEPTLNLLKEAGGYFQCEDATFQSNSIVFTNSYMDIERAQAENLPAFRMPVDDQLWRADLRDYETRAKELRIRQVRGWIYKAIQTAAIAACGLLLLQFASLFLQNELSQRYSRILEDEGAAQLISDQQQSLRTLQAFDNEELRPFRMLEAVNAIRPKTIYFESVSSEQSNVMRIRGIAPSVPALQSFQKQLNTQDALKEAILEEFPINGGKVNFSMRLHFNKPENASSTLARTHQ